MPLFSPFFLGDSEGLGCVLQLLEFLRVAPDIGGVLLDRLAVGVVQLLRCGAAGDSGSHKNTYVNLSRSWEANGDGIKSPRHNILWLGASFCVAAVARY